MSDSLCAFRITDDDPLRPLPMRRSSSEGFFPARRFIVLVLLAPVAVLLSGWPCGSSSSAAESSQSQVLTPLLLSVPSPPIPFVGSDGKTHLAYELWMSNFSSAKATVQQARISSDGTVIQTLEKSAIAKQLQPAGLRESSALMPASTQSLLFIDLIAPAGATPQRLSHQVAADFVLGSTHRQFNATIDDVLVKDSPVAVIGPPLRGENYISADSCCGAVRHTRAALAVNGRVWLGQRFAVDWEQLDSENRVHGSKETPAATDIRPEVLAGANGTAVAINDQPIRFPSIPCRTHADQADGTWSS